MRGALLMRKVKLSPASRQPISWRGQMKRSTPWAFSRLSRSSLGAPMLRQMAPFAGVLTVQERDAVLREVYGREAS